MNAIKIKIAQQFLVRVTHSSTLSVYTAIVPQIYVLPCVVLQRSIPNTFLIR